MKAPSTSHVRRQWRGWIVLAAFCCSVPGLMPALFALAAGADGSHGVEMRTSNEEVRVVLTHGACNARRLHAQIHEHCPIARMLTFLSDQEDGTPDHVLKFGGNTPRVMEDRLAIQAAEWTADEAVPRFVLVVEIALPRAPMLPLWPMAAPPGEAPPAGLVGLKSTLLLI